MWYTVFFLHQLYFLKVSFFKVGIFQKNMCFDSESRSWCTGYWLARVLDENPDGEMPRRHGWNGSCEMGRASIYFEPPCLTKWCSSWHVPHKGSGSIFELPEGGTELFFFRLAVGFFHFNIGKACNINKSSGFTRVPSHFFTRLQAQIFKTRLLLEVVHWRTNN